jgi:serine/threonine protein kinase
VVGGLFAVCLRRKADLWLEDMSARHAASLNDETSSFTSATKTTSSSEMIFAMKSIHLSRITDDTFVQELRNEISILKTLDHPHIVKAIETFDHRNQLFVIMELCSGGDLCTSLGCDVCMWMAMFVSLLRRTIPWLHCLSVDFSTTQIRVIRTPKRKQHVSQVRF